MLLMMIVRRMIAQPQLWTMPCSHFREPEERRRDDGENAVVDDEVEALASRASSSLLLRPHVERHANHRRRPRRDRSHRHDHPAA
jgi:hypothetical protein